jgi:hypothetical protein
MDSTRVVWARSISAVPWAAVALVLAITAFVNATVDIDSLQLDIGGLVPPNLPIEPAGDLPSISRHLFVRLAWGISAIGFALVALASLAMSVFVFWSCVKEIPPRQRIETACLIGFVVVLLLALMIARGDWVLSEPSITTSLRKATMHRTSATHAVSVDSFFDNVSAVLFLCLIAAASATLISPRRTALTAESLSRRLGQLRLLLYFGASALVLRALEMYSLYRWPGAWFPAETADLIDRIAIALSTAHGAFFTAILMSLYIPAAFILRYRANWLARQVVRGTAEEREAWMTKMGLTFSPFQEVAGLFATVAPLIAGGSVTRVLDMLNG